jgi:A/G-specific adenine glycosylase
LPGIGRSTAAAISVFAFGRRAAILDGNVKRVLATLLRHRADAIGGSSTERRAVGPSRIAAPGEGIEAYTQGMMDLGATLCPATSPACDACPLQEVCVACRDGRQADLPRPGAAKRCPNGRASVYCSATAGGAARTPAAERHLGRPAELARSGRRVGRNLCPAPGLPAAREHAGLPPIRHAFTHFRLTIDVLRCEVEVIGRDAREAGWQWLPLETGRDGGVADADQEAAVVVA